MKNRAIKLFDVYAFVPNTNKNKQIQLFLKLDKDFYNLRDGKKLKEFNVWSFDKYGNATVTTNSQELQPIGKMCKLAHLFNANMCLNSELYLVDSPEFAYKNVNSIYYTTIKEMQRFEHLWNKRRLAMEKSWEKEQKNREKINLKNKDLAKNVEETYNQFKDGSIEK